MKTSLLPRLLLAIAVLMGAAAVQAQQVFRMTAIPDESPTELARKAAPLLKYLERKLGVKAEFTPVTDYAAAVEALAHKQVDLAWLGGFTFVQANQRSGGKIVPLVQRAEDEKFRSVFITTNPAIKSLADLKGMELRVAGTNAEVVKRLGGIPVAMPQSDTPEAIQKGVVKGMVSSMEILKDFKFAAYTPYATTAKETTGRFAIVAYGV